MSEETKTKTKTKEPAKKRKITANIGGDEIFGNRMKIPDEILEWAESNGMSKDNFRWLRSQDVYQNQGYHPKGWQVFRDTSGTIKNELGFGADPEGVVRRGDSILGFKTNDQLQKHRSHLKARRDRQQPRKVYERQVADLKSAAGSANVKIHMGLDSNDE